MIRLISSSAIVLGTFAHAVTTARPDMAVYEISTEQGMRLSAVALKTIGVEVARVESTRVPVDASALVRFQEKVGVYRVRDGWFKLIVVPTPSAKIGAATILEHADLRPGDGIVVRGADLLRVAELDAFSTGG